MTQKHLGNTLLPEHFVPRVPVAGVLKIGDLETSNGKAIPKKLDFVRFCGPSATKDGAYPDHPSFSAENKAKLKTVQIELVSDDPALNLEVTYILANRGRVLCTGNGVRARRRRNDRGDMVPEAPYQDLPEGSCGQACPFWRQKACKLSGVLRFLLPGKTALGTTWTFRTTSWNTICDLVGGMESLQNLTGGVLARLPLNFGIVEQRRTVQVGEKRTGSKFWTVALSFPGTEEELVQAVRRARNLAADMAALRLTSVEDSLKASSHMLPSDLPEEEQLALAAEFFPGPGGATTLPAESTGNMQLPVPTESTPSELPPLAEKAPAGPTSAQVDLLLKHAAKAGMQDQTEALREHLGSLSRTAVSALISQVLQDPSVLVHLPLQSNQESTP